MHLPVELRATTRGMSITFSGDLVARDATKAANYAVKVWALERTKRYGSKHHDEHALTVTKVRLADDGRTVHLEIPGIAPTMCMEIKYSLTAPGGKVIRGVIHNTVHKLSK